MSELVLLNSPRSKTDLFVSFTLLALQGFGGVLAVVQRELVEKKRWMTREQFVEDWAVAQVMPGPNVVNLSLMIGGRYFGLPGALAGVAGMLAAPLVVVLLLAVAFGGVSQEPWAQGALRGMGAVSAGLIAAVGLKLITALRHNPMGKPVCIALALATFAGVGVLRWPLFAVLLGTGLMACAWAYLQLARQASQTRGWP
ncbi:chromate transporter [Limnohabitans sp. yimb22184]|uniref:chromate transporter n=1 Tax=Limnohabitans sp. YIMB22184 TaxID=3374104 RepID=UPI003A8879C9